MPSIVEKPFVSYKGMKKSAQLLYDFFYFYFPLHGLKLKDFFAYYPILGFVEAMVYETDVLVEAGQADNAAYAGETPVTRMKNIDLELLKSLDLYDPMIEKELENGERYYRLENKMMHDKVVTHEIVIEAAEYRTFDLRVLHTILLKLLKKPYDEKLFQLIHPVEVIADIEDDLKQYQDDVKDNSYNTYRMFVKLYGKEARQRLQKEIKRYEDMMFQGLAKISCWKRWKYLKMLAIYRKDHPETAIPEPILEWDGKNQ
jgi:hypothetical protein